MNLLDFLNVPSLIGSALGAMVFWCLGAYVAVRDCIYGDTFPGYFYGKCFGKAMHTGFGCGIIRLPGISVNACGAGDVDDASGSLF